MPLISKRVFTWIDRGGGGGSGGGGKAEGESA